ncbi:MAG: type II toxin-antitoxin system RelE/ParE family toxin, partial [Planctomycetaceae bacterium]|nr:type II toxin-antitoxin system RelE/ParE family toxin [Planctomycetaceae bacterium]
MTSRILSIAQREFVEAVEWYAARDERIAAGFVDEYERATREIVQRPQQFACAEGVESPRDIRQVLMRRFPYVVYFELGADEVVILAVSHAAREPGYWLEGR